MMGRGYDGLDTVVVEKKIESDDPSKDQQQMTGGSFC
jgi:hypothetical protein